MPIKSEVTLYSRGTHRDHENTDLGTTVFALAGA